MAKITSKSQLNDGTEIVIDTTNKTIQLVATGNLVAKDGATLRAVYSKVVDLWNTSTYNNYTFPMYAKDTIAGEYTIGFDGINYNGWNWKDTNTRNYLRDGGWNEYDSSGVLQKVYCCFYGLGNLAGSGDQPYYQLTNGGSPINFTYTDMPNLGVKVYDYNGGSPVDNRSYAKVYDRSYGYKFTSSTLSNTRSSATGAYVVAFPLTTTADDKITDNDATVASSAPYTGITATWIVGNGFSNAVVGSLAVNDVRKDTAGRWFICTGAGTIDAAGVANYTLNGGSATLTSYSGERDINGTYYAFNIIIDGNTTIAEKVYTKLQYLLRQNSDIDSGAGTRTGKITDILMTFEGSSPTTQTGVYVDNILPADSTRWVFTDVLGVPHSVPVITNQSVTISGATAGSRIQIYDLTSSTELYNGTPTFPYTWTDSNPYVADRDIRLTVTYVNGTSAKKYIRLPIGTATATDYAVRYTVNQEDDINYNTNAVDGSTVNDVAVNYGTGRMTVNKSAITWPELYAYEMYWLNTSTGIAGDGQIITAVDTANYFVDDSVAPNLIENIYTNGVKASGGWGRLIGTDDPGVFLTSGYSVFPQVPHVVAYAVGSGVTPTDISNIISGVWSDNNTYGSGTKGGDASKTLKLAKFIRNSIV